MQNARDGPLRCDPERVGQPEDNRPPSFLDIVGFSELRPIRRGRRPLVLSKPPKAPNQMTFEEIDAWVSIDVIGVR